jgi:hypothetical protein
MKSALIVFLFLIWHIPAVAMTAYCTGPGKIAIKLFLDSKNEVSRVAYRIAAPRVITSAAVRLQHAYIPQENLYRFAPNYELRLPVRLSAFKEDVIYGADLVDVRKSLSGSALANRPLVCYNRAD